jgi:NitT/TauT family transport system permease protein
MNLLGRRFSHQGIVAAWILSLLLLWELAAWFVDAVLSYAAPASKLPYLHRVLSTMFVHFSTLVQQGGTTFGNALTGFLIGTFFGLTLAILMSISKTLEHTISPYAIASQMVPIIGLAPIIYGIVHDAALSRIIMAAYVTFFPVTIHTLRGLKSISPSQLELMYSYAASTWKTYTKLKLIAALPGLFSGMKLAAPLAISAAIVVELMGAPNGLGVLMLSSLYYGNSQVYMFWSTIIASLCIGFIAFLLISFIERRVTPWQPEFRSGRRGEI